MSFESHRSDQIRRRRLVAHLIVLVVVGAVVVLVLIGVLHIIGVLLSLSGVVDDLTACAATTLDDVVGGDGLEVVVIFFLVCDALVLVLIDCRK